MTNQILLKQNQPELIQLLKASAAAYTESKKGELYITYFIILLAIAYPISYILIQNEELKYILFGGSFLITILIQAYSGFFKGNTAMGAVFKEVFDTELFGMRWKSTIKRPDYSEVMQMAKKYQGKEIVDWYSPNLGEEVPNLTSIAMLQHSNTSWDISLRNKFMSHLIKALTAYIILLFIFLFASNSDGKTIFLVLFSLLSVFSHFINIIRGHNDAIIKRKEISKRLNEIITKRKRITMVELRDIQDEIYQTRKEPAKVPDFFFRMYRDSMDSVMHEYIMRINSIYIKENSHRT